MFSPILDDVQLFESTFSTDHQRLVANPQFGLKGRNSRSADGKWILRFVRKVEDIGLMDYPSPYLVETEIPEDQCNFKYYIIYFDANSSIWYRSIV